MNGPKFYTALEKRFKNIKGPLDLRSFAFVEALLYLFSETDPENDELDPRKAFNILAGYNIINANGCIGSLEHKIQAARRHIWHMGMESSWKKHLEGYRNPVYDGLRVYSIEGTDTFSFKRTENKFLSFEARLEDWRKLWLAMPEQVRQLKIAENGQFMFYYPSEKGGVKAKIGKISLGQADETTDFFLPTKGQRPDIEIPLCDPVFRQS